MLTAEQLKSQLEYNPETGLFRWIVQKSGRGAKGWFGGADRGGGYLAICVDGRNYRAHRLAWLYMTGQWPEHQIDHRNRNPSDNRFENLRDLPPQQNTQNQDGKPERRVTRRGIVWRARVCVNGRAVLLGNFDSEEAANAARVEAKKRLHPGYISPEITRKA